MEQQGAVSLPCASAMAGWWSAGITGRGGEGKFTEPERFAGPCSQAA